MQESVHRIQWSAGRMKAGTNSAQDQLVENLQLDLYNYVRAALAALETPTPIRRGLLGGSVHNADTSIVDGLKSLIETVERPHVSSTNVI